MDFEVLKTLSEGGAWLTLAGVLIWVIKKMMDEDSKQRKRHALERLSQEGRHRAERDAFMRMHREERDKWVQQETERSNKISQAISDAIRFKP